MSRTSNLSSYRSRAGSSWSGLAGLMIVMAPLGVGASEPEPSAGPSLAPTVGAVEESASETSTAEVDGQALSSSSEGSASASDEPSVVEVVEVAGDGASSSASVARATATSTSSSAPEPIADGSAASTEAGEAEAPAAVEGAGADGAPSDENQADAAARGKGRDREQHRQRRADDRHALNLDEGTMLRNRWPFEPVCNLGLSPDLCLTIDAEVFTGYRMRSIAGERFGEFALDRGEFGTNFWYRANKWIDGGVALRLESVRSAGPQSLIGIDGDSLVIRLAQAYGHTAAHVGPISIGFRGGMIPERWIEQVEKGYDTVGVGRLASEQNLLMERADLGGSLTVSGWQGLVELDLQMTNGEGRAQEELNRGKNTMAMFTVRPLRHRHAKGPITLALHGAYRDGSWGVAAARAHRAAGAVTFASPWAFAGAELVQAFGVREQGDRVSRSVGGWLSAYAWQPYVGLVAKYDHIRQDLELDGSSVDIITAGVFSDLFGYTWRRRRRVRLYAAYQHERYGNAAGPVPGAPQAADSHRFLLQIEAAGLLRAL